MISLSRPGVCCIEVRACAIFQGRTSSTENATDAEPDWEKLRAIGAEATRLQDEGMWTKEAFERLYALAEQSSNGDTDISGFLLDLADWSWFKDER